MTDGTKHLKMWTRTSRCLAFTPLYRREERDKNRNSKNTTIRTEVFDDWQVCPLKANAFRRCESQEIGNFKCDKGIKNNEIEHLDVDSFNLNRMWGKASIVGRSKRRHDDALPISVETFKDQNRMWPSLIKNQDQPRKRYGRAVQLGTTH